MKDQSCQLNIGCLLRAFSKYEIIQGNHSLIDSSRINCFYYLQLVKQKIFVAIKLLLAAFKFDLLFVSTKCYK